MEPPKFITVKTDLRAKLEKVGERFVIYKPMEEIQSFGYTLEALERSLAAGDIIIEE